MHWLRLIVLIVALGGTQAALAVQPDEMLRDPGLEARARALSRELRCMVCQNQSIDDSDAPLARDLRLLVRERLAAGDSDDGVLDFVVARYGEFVLLRPRLSRHTVILWTAPFVLLLIGAAAITWATRRRSLAAPPLAPLSDEERERLAAIGGTGPDGKAGRGARLSE
jgi:cytochrome c-type biogenesis protein CcmH